MAKPKPVATSTKRRIESESEDEGYRAKSHKRKKNSVDSGDSWRRGAAKQVVTYDETQGNEDLLESESEAEPTTEGEFDKFPADSSWS